MFVVPHKMNTKDNSQLNMDIVFCYSIIRMFKNKLQFKCMIWFLLFTFESRGCGKQKQRDRNRDKSFT